MPPIKYISYFDRQDANVQRNYVTSCVNKMEYIAEALVQAGYDVQIVSNSAVIEPKFRFYRGSNTEFRPGIRLKLFPSWGGNNKILRILRVIWHLAALFTYLLIHTRKGEPVISYHSQGYFNVLNWAKRIRKFRLISEVEEIYQDVQAAKYSAMAKAEYATFALADAFIFPTELLNQKLNPQGRPYTIIYGTYKVEPQVVEKFNDGKIHVVYAGTFDPRKGGAAAAAAAAAHLPANYHLHILGFGSGDDTRLIKETIAETAAKTQATITFDGLKKGRAYIEFIQRCHIGLSTQDPSAAFNATSFPSKILSYMANGLEVVSIDIPAIRTAAIAPNLHFYTEQTPQQIAAAILGVDLSHPHPNRDTIAKLAAEFQASLPSIIQ